MSKYVVGGKTYNTETAEHIGDYWNGFGSSDFKNCRFDLYRTKKGAFFIVGEGGPMSRFSQAYGNMTGGGSGIEIWSEKEAKEWCEENLTTEKYITVFGEPEEA